MYGLKNSNIDEIKKTLKQFPEIEEAYIFGSRAKGTEKKGSDIDIALKGKKISSKTIFKLHTILEEELSLPYFFDILNYHQISDKALVEHIDRVGKKII